MIYRFIQPIILKSGVVIPETDPIILDDPDAPDEVAVAVREAIAAGLLQSDEPKPTKKKKEQ